MNKIKVFFSSQSKLFENFSDCSDWLNKSCFCFDRVNRLLLLFPILEPISLPVVVAQPDKSYANRTASVLEWYDRHRA